MNLCNCFIVFSQVSCPAAPRRAPQWSPPEGNFLIHPCVDDEGIHIRRRGVVVVCGCASVSILFFKRPLIQWTELVESIVNSVCAMSWKRTWQFPSPHVHDAWCIRNFVDNDPREYESSSYQILFYEMVSSYVHCNTLRTPHATQHQFPYLLIDCYHLDTRINMCNSAPASAYYCRLKCLK